MTTSRWFISVTLVALAATRLHAIDPQTIQRAAIDKGVDALLSIQEKTGSWSYEGVYRVRGEIPIGYRVGGTAIVSEVLLHAGRRGQAIDDALDRAVAFILEALQDPRMAPSDEDRYDVRIWGHAYVLEFFCQLTAENRAGRHREQVDKAITQLVEAILVEEHASGGWNYASRRRPASFVTAPVVQSLLWAKTRGASIPPEVFERARHFLLAARSENGAFQYSGSGRRAKLPGSIARSAVCEVTLRLMNSGSAEAIQEAIDAFHEHWNELEKRRKQHGTHKPPYGIAPYYFYFGHRYAAQAVETLPEPARRRERRRLAAVVMKTRDPDGTWNDRVFARSRNYGTAMALLALLADRIPAPPGLTP